ncbi:MAG: ATP synthase F0 sector subunit c [uncultured Campylobacterales bacterium]|uniref:ATP synthase subunit c n=1 Tax=uncultured Campylobacterales bacterium TaxID=352960 RepID=A0A6S6SP01_9BACT|nr:MAG: ATP synthase F0 sector subunit c [uncultured Campylobacterales bacterium]
MKKGLILLFVALSGLVFGAEAESAKIALNTDSGTLLAFGSIIAAGFGVGIAAVGGSIAMGNTAAATISGIARNPGVGKDLTKTMFIAIALIEAQVIYTLVIAFIVLFGNPFIG